MKRYIFTLALAAMLAFTGCGTAQDTAQEPAEDEEILDEVLAAGKDYKLRGIDENKLSFNTDFQGTAIQREAVLDEKEAAEVVRMINSAQKGTECTYGDYDIWFTDGDTKVGILTLPDGKAAVSICGSQDISAELTAEQKNRINEMIKAETGVDPF